MNPNEKAEQARELFLSGSNCAQSVYAAFAEDMGMTVEVRQIPEDEIGTFDEAGACGTAAVISPIARIDDLDENKSYIFSKDGKPGPICEKLYNKLRAIQYGDEPDTHKWITIVE